MERQSKTKIRFKVSIVLNIIIILLYYYFFNPISFPFLQCLSYTHTGCYALFFLVRLNLRFDGEDESLFEMRIQTAMQNRLLSEVKLVYT